MEHAITRSHISYLNTPRMWKLPKSLSFQGLTLVILDDSVFIVNN